MSDEQKCLLAVIQHALDVANGRWDEWGERALMVEAILENAIKERKLLQKVRNGVYNYGDGRKVKFDKGYIVEIVKNNTLYYKQTLSGTTGNPSYENHPDYFYKSNL